MDGFYDRKIVLASASPRRQELLKYIVNDFEVCVSKVDENIDLLLKPQKIVKELALRKACDVAKSYNNALIIGADTIVYHKKTVLGKPRDYEDAVKMLTALSGDHHFVYTGVCIYDSGNSTYESKAVKTKVYFDNINNGQICEYVSKTKPYDKAGAYGIQDAAARFIYGIKGCYYNVMGLPINTIYNLLLKFGT